MARRHKGAGPLRFSGADMSGSRRTFLGAATIGAGWIGVSEAVQPATVPMAGAGGAALDSHQLPPGEAVATHGAGSAMPEFRYALDGMTPKVATGGYAKEVTAEHFPISTMMSGVHMFLDPGAARELHWHAVAAEWAFVIAGRCQTVVLTPDGTSEINNYEPGDLWLFPKGHGHSIQTIGDQPCHFILSFNNGDTSPEHETFSLTDWLDVTPKGWLALEFSMPVELFEPFPKGEVYIQAGPVLPRAKALDAPWPKQSTHRFSLMKTSSAVRDFAGGTFRLATAKEWPISQDMAGGLITIRPGQMLNLHWHPNANEWNYVLRGKAQIALFGSGGRSKVAEFAPGDAAYYPQGYGHAIRNIGTDDLAIVQTWDNGMFEEIILNSWIRASPGYLLANNFAGVPADVIAKLKAD